MEQHHKRGKFGKLGLIIGMLAVGFVLGSFLSRGGPREGWGDGPRGPAAWQQQMPQAPQAPQAQPAPQALQAPGFGPDQRMPRGWQGDPGQGMHGFQGGPGGEMGWAHGRMGGHRHGGFLFGIFGLIGGLIKLVFGGLAIYLIFIAIRDRLRSKHDGPNGDSGSSQAPNTGMTTSL